MIPFTDSKAKARHLNQIGLEECLKLFKTGKKIRYFGLPSPKVEDLKLLKKHLAITHAVERGLKGMEWKWQHDLVVEAMLAGIPGFRLYRGDIDDIMLNGSDSFNFSIEWPYDFINLDYTGGIIYKDETGKSKRISALKHLLRMQGERNSSFFLAITVNDKHHDQGEINTILSEFAQDSQRKGRNIQQQIDKIKQSGDRRKAIFIYTSFIVIETARNWFKGEILKPIFYTGWGGYKMLNMSYCLKYMDKRDAPTKDIIDPLKLITKGIIDLNEKNSTR
jgi:hypothetical protein